MNCWLTLLPSHFGFAVLLLCFLTTPLYAMETITDMPYASTGERELQKAYEANARIVKTRWIVEAGHTSGEYFRSPYIEQVADFLTRVLK